MNHEEKIAMNHIEASAASAENSKKLDRMIILLEGAGADTPGLVQIVSSHSEALFGVRGRNGIIQRVDVMWRVHVWILCSVSAGAGIFATKAVEYLAKHI